MDTPYDVVIIGSGLGGLVCGTILAKEGYKVCILERNKQIGGTLQTFVRKRVIFDSGVHYVGGLEPGQNLYQFFRYLGIMEKMKIRKMDLDSFDTIIFEDDPVEYKYAQGYDRFIQVLSEQFPGEKESIRRYCDAIRDVCSKFPMYNLRTGSLTEKVEALETDAKTYIETFTTNKKLQNVLAGTNLLYAGEPEKTPFYVHALVVNSYIESSYKFLDGGSQIGKHLAREIISRGGKIIKHAEVTRIVEEEGLVTYVEVNGNQKYFGKTFISNIHPQKTLQLTNSDKIKKVYRQRIKSLQNSVSAFALNIVLKRNSVPYINKNYYVFKELDVWNVAGHTEETWPKGYALFYTPARGNEEFSDAVTIMAYMHFHEVEQWKDTFNTVAKESTRGESYEAFKKEKAEKLLKIVYERFPELEGTIDEYYVSTPLTLRDYVGSDDGSLYGITKDFRDPMKTFIAPRTKIPNLLLTGQNLNLHGVLGVTVSGVLTCSQLIGGEYLIEKIRNA